MYRSMHIVTQLCTEKKGTQVRICFADLVRAAVGGPEECGRAQSVQPSETQGPTASAAQRASQTEKKQGTDLLRLGEHSAGFRDALRVTLEEGHDRQGEKRYTEGTAKRSCQP